MGAADFGFAATTGVGATGFEVSVGTVTMAGAGAALRVTGLLITTVAGAAGAATFFTGLLDTVAGAAGAAIVLTVRFGSAAVFAGLLGRGAAAAVFLRTAELFLRRVVVIEGAPVRAPSKVDASR